MLSFLPPLSIPQKNQSSALHKYMSPNQTLGRASAPSLQHHKMYGLMPQFLWCAAFYNAFFTALPVGAFAIFDRPVRLLMTLQRNPQVGLGSSIRKETVCVCCEPKLRVASKHIKTHQDQAHIG